MVSIHNVGDLTLSEYNQIINVVNEIGGVDLSDYANSSLKRRFSRYIINNNIKDIDHLLGEIRNDNGSLDKFVRDITVNTTEMFRDPTFWERLKSDVLPSFTNKDRINIWHAACSTGEEVISMAILMKEMNMLDKVKIIASDINRNVLEVATNRTYSLRNQKTNRANYESFGGKGRLEDYYEENQNMVVYNSDLTKNVEFRSHNLAQDGNFSQFDLIICRNVLIYFNSKLQENVIQLFNESLNNGGYLGIGSKESIVWCKAARNLSVVSLNDNIFKKDSK
jgi:chemotaxis protein methyltransferase CheR